VLTLVTYAIGYVMVIAALLVLNHILRLLRREDADEEARREVARWQSFLPPGNDDPYSRPPSVQSNHPPQREKVRRSSTNH
jgi:plasmid stabilization system protein ParE